MISCIDSRRRLKGNRCTQSASIKLVVDIIENYNIVLNAVSAANNKVIYLSLIDICSQLQC